MATGPDPSAQGDGWRQRLDKWRRRHGHRAAALLIALLLEGMLALLLLTLAPQIDIPDSFADMTAFSIDAEPASEEAAAPAAAEQADPAPAPAPPAAPAEPQRSPPEQVTPPPVPAPQPSPLPWIPLTREQMASADIDRPRTPPSAPAPSRRVYGPPDTGPRTGSGFGDSERVEGSGPNGEPLYAASWYREPYPEELRGYLSTASGPGWGLIACRTVPDYRVDNCVALGEYPQGSNIVRAVLAAAWQFRVRPPRIGGRPQVGEWVRIRIDYQTRRPER